MLSDDALLDAFIRDGSDRAFRDLYERHAKAMYALALRLMGSRRDEAADVLQDAWLRALPKLSGFRRESSLRTWLCGFIVNGARERFRGPWFEELTDEVNCSTHPDLAIDLERALELLADGYRAVIVLHDIEGYTHREIADALSIDEGTSKSQLSRARAILRRRLRQSRADAR